MASNANVNARKTTIALRRLSVVSGTLLEPWYLFGWRFPGLPIVSIAAPFCGLTNPILRILNGSPKKELQWRL